MTLHEAAIGGRTEISVQDSGIGIDPAYKERVFDRFFRVPSNTPLPPGSGLGLSLAKWIAERHGTQLHLESIPGHGSRFSFSLERSSTVLQAIHDSPMTSEPGKKTSVPSLADLLHDAVVK